MPGVGGALVCEVARGLDMQLPHQPINPISGATKYSATVKYYVVDRYDFYEPDPVDGKENEVGFVTNDGYVILSYFDYAEPFDVVGYYTQSFEWYGN